MKNFIRGGLALFILCLFVIFIYSQTRTAVTVENEKAEDMKAVVSINSFDQSDSNTITEQKNHKKEVNDIQEADKTTDKAALQKKEIIEQEKQTESRVKKTVSSRAVRVSKGRFTATAYCLRGRTATGGRVRQGIIAADPRVLPLGSKINIEGGSQSGNYIVADTGGKIKGKRIDIWMPSCAAARRFGRRSVNISILN